MAREGYRDSGVEWIGEIPQGWEVNKLKKIAEVITGTTPSRAIEANYGGSIPWYKPANISDNTFVSKASEYLSQQGIENARLVPAHSILVCCIGTLGKTAISEERCATNQQINSIVFDSNKMNYKYGYYANTALLPAYEQYADGASVIAMLNKSQNEDIKFPLPPLPEQLRIAEYLDFETGKIDALVSELTEFSKTLKMRTKSLIAECVTKGLPSSRQGRPMRDSGVEWIGEVPEEWEVPQIGKVTGIINGGTPDSANPIYWDGDIPWVTPADMDGTHFERLKKGRRSITEAGLKDFNGVLVPKGSVILSKRAPIGLVALAGEKIATNQGCCTLVCDSKLNSKYMYYYLTSHTDYMNSLGKGTTFLEISNASLKGMRAPLPPLSEQLAIADYLDSEVAKSDALIASVASLIEDLRVYRKALISEVVTGRRRV